MCLATNRLVALEKHTHLLLTKPHGVVFEADFQPDGLVRLIDDDFIGLVRHGGCDGVVDWDSNTLSSPAETTSRFL